MSARRRLREHHGSLEVQSRVQTKTVFCFRASMPLHFPRRLCIDCRLQRRRRPRERPGTAAATAATHDRTANRSFAFDRQNLE